MTPDEEIIAVRETLGKLEHTIKRADVLVSRLHRQLGEAVQRHGCAVGVSSDMVAAAVAPKDPPPENP